MYTIEGKIDNKSSIGNRNSKGVLMKYYLMEKTQVPIRLHIKKIINFKGKR